MESESTFSGRSRSRLKFDSAALLYTREPAQICLSNGCGENSMATESLTSQLLLPIPTPGDPRPKLASTVACHRGGAHSTGSAPGQPGQRRVDRARPTRNVMTHKQNTEHTGDTSPPTVISCFIVKKKLFHQ